MTPTLAKYHWGIWQKAVFVFLRMRGKKRAGPVGLTLTRLFSVHILQFLCGVWLNVLQWMSTIQSNDVCVSRVPHLSTVLSITSTPIVCCVGPLWHQLGDVNVCILQCPFWAESACVQFAGLLVHEGYSESLCSLTLRMRLLLHCKCNL